MVDPISPAPPFSHSSLQRRDRRYSRSERADPTTASIVSAKLVGKVLLLDLEQRDKLVLTALAWHANDAGLSCYPSIATIMTYSSCGERTVQRSLIVLRDAGLVTVTVGGGHATNDYELHVDAPLPPSLLTGVTPATADAPTPVTRGSGPPSPRRGTPVTAGRIPPSRVTGDTKTEPRTEPKTGKKSDPLSFSQRVFGTAASMGSSENGQVPPKSKRRRASKPAYTPAFEELWAIRRKGGKRDAFNAFVELVPAEVSLETAKQKLLEYVAHLEGFPGKNLSTWLNKQGWEEDHTKVDDEPKYRPPPVWKEPGMESASAVAERMDPKTRADMERMQEEGAKFLEDRDKNRPTGGPDDGDERTENA